MEIRYNRNIRCAKKSLLFTLVSDVPIISYPLVFARDIAVVLHRRCTPAMSQSPLSTPCR